MNDKKIEILLDSFEKLKSKINDSDRDYLYSIHKIIKKLFSYDKDMAVNIWEFCLKEFQNYEDDYRYCNHMWAIIGCPFDDYIISFGLDNTLNLLNNHPVIKSTIFEKWYHYSNIFFEKLAASNKLFELDEYLCLLENNKKFLNNHSYDDGIGELLKSLTSNLEFLPTAECVELLLNHAKLANEENQSIINVNLIDYL